MIIWGRPPIGLQVWHAVDVHGRAFLYDDDGCELERRTEPLLVHITMRTELPAGWAVRAAKAQRIIDGSYR